MLAVAAFDCSDFGFAPVAVSLFMRLTVCVFGTCNAKIVLDFAYVQRVAFTPLRACLIAHTHTHTYRKRGVECERKRWDSVKS